MMPDKRFAVLIDAENISDKYIQSILNEISNDGRITYKRIYGDWTRPGMSSWKNILLNYSITPIQQFNYTSGKSSSDSAMIIDAMDILYSGNVDGFCIVSSDSDFTRLAIRLRESGMYVVGMGESKTPYPFMAACNRFKTLQLFEDEKINNQIVSVTKTQSQSQSNNNVVMAISAIINNVADESGKASLGDVGNELKKIMPNFNVKNYGYKKFTQFIESLNEFEVISVSSKGNPSSTINYVKLKNKYSVFR